MVVVVVRLAWVETVVRLSGIILNKSNNDNDENNENFPGFDFDFWV